MQMAKRGIAADPNEPWAHWGLASVLIMQKRFGEALMEYEKAYDLNPTTPTSSPSSAGAWPLQAVPKRASC
jgi:cytochrome c-type biogenesis protein CcmH/NrfG